MGVTIHFEGRLKTPRDLLLLIEQARRVAAERGWVCKLLSEKLPHVLAEQAWDNRDPTSGIEILPHERSDPLRFRFDSELYTQDFIKTQFAGPAVHVQVVHLLRSLEPRFDRLTVEDEADFWSCSDNDVLQGHFSAFDRALAEHLRQHPGAQGPVRLPSGRWVDVIS